MRCLGGGLHSWSAFLVIIAIIIITIIIIIKLLLLLLLPTALYVQGRREGGFQGFQETP